MGTATIDRETRAWLEFNQHFGRDDGELVTRSLNSGLILVRDLFYGRMHYDVEKIVGTDSMLVPVSEMKTQKAAKSAIDVYQVVESGEAMCHLGFVAPEDEWPYAWLGRLRLGPAYDKRETLTQINRYCELTPRARQLALTDILLRVLPESRRAPLVLYRLVPLAVHIATAVAFGNTAVASQIRRQQISELPAITDCHRCRGAVMDNGDLCDVCGNPLWRFEWLNSTD